MHLPAFRKLITGLIAILLWPGVIFPASGQNRFQEVEVPRREAMGDLRVMAEVLAMYAVDYGHYPVVEGVEALIQVGWQEGYLSTEIRPVKDPWGQVYHVETTATGYRLGSAGPDGRWSTEDDLVLNGTLGQAGEVPSARSRREGHDTRPRHLTRKLFSCPTGTCLTVTKSGNDLVLSWTGTGPTYDGTKSPDVLFLNAELMFQGLAATTYTYRNALNNGIDLEFFDVTDPTETNRGADGNGQLPPPPPVIGSPSGSWFIGVRQPSREAISPKCPATI